MSIALKKWCFFWRSVYFHDSVFMNWIANYTPWKNKGSVTYLQNIVGVLNKYELILTCTKTSILFFSFQMLSVKGISEIFGEPADVMLPLARLFNTIDA